MSRNVTRLTSLVVVALVLSVLACDDKPTRPPTYSPYPQQLFSPSADSHYVYFRDSGTAFGRPAGIYRFPIEGEGAVEPVIVHSPAYFPRISPSGRQLAFVDLANALIIRELDSGKDSVLLRADVVDIDWYNEDTLVCGVFHGQVLTIEVATGNSYLVWSGNGWQPTVADQGTVAVIQYYAKSALVDSSAIVLTSLNGDSLGGIATFAKEFCSEPDFNELGTEVILVRDYLNMPRLAIVNVQDGHITDSIAMLSVDPYFTQNDRVLYVALGDKGRGQKDEIWIMDADGYGKELLLH